MTDGISKALAYRELATGNTARGGASSSHQGDLLKGHEADGHGYREVKDVTNYRTRWRNDLHRGWSEERRNECLPLGRSMWRE